MTAAITDQSSSSQETTQEEITDAELLNMAIDNRLIDLHTGIPARVESYDKAAGTVNVTLMINRDVPDGAGGYVSEELSPMSKVPIRWPRTKKFAFTLPIEKGDSGVVKFCERSISRWRATGAQASPGDVGMHTLDGGFFELGLYPDDSPPKNADAANMVLGSETDGNSRLEIKPSGGMNLGAGATKGVARMGDTTAPGETMAAWISAVSTFINGLVPASVVPPSDFGKINQASGNIKAVD